MAFSDDFTSSIDTGTWVVTTSGTGTATVVSNKAQLYKPASADKAILVAKSGQFASATTNTVTALVDVSVPVPATGYTYADTQQGLVALVRKSSAPAGGDTHDYRVRIESYYAYVTTGSAGYRRLYRFWYKDTGGTSYWYDFGSASWGTGFDTAFDGTGAWKQYPGGTGANDALQYRYILETDASSGVRCLVKSADGLTTHDTSAYIPWASIGGSGDFYVALGGPAFETTGMLGTVNVDSVSITSPAGTTHLRHRPRGLYVR